MENVDFFREEEEDELTEMEDELADSFGEVDPNGEEEEDEVDVENFDDRDEF